MASRFLEVTRNNAAFVSVSAPAADFDPASLYRGGERGAFLDYSDLSTLFQDAAGSTPVTADGDPVGRVEDKSGNGTHATQSVAADRPLYKTAAGLHWLENDGAGDGLALPGLDLAPASGTSTWTYAVGLETGDTAFVMLNPVSNFFAMIGQSGNLNTDLVSTASGFMALTNMYVDGALASPSTWDDVYDLLVGTHTGWQEFTVSSAATFNNVNLFRFAAAGTYHFSGKVFATILIERALTAAERAKVQAYIAGKAGI